MSDGVLRTVFPPYSSEISCFLATPLATRLVEQCRIVASEVVNGARGGELMILRHPKVSFVSYPAEWPPSLWLAAANATLSLCEELLEEGWILKDATPLNILFQGSKPIFVDILSIQRADLSKPIWYAYAQFIRTFLLPMLAHSRLGWPLHSVLSKRDGFEPEEVYTALPWTRRFTRPALTSVTIPRFLAKRSAAFAARMPQIAPSDPALTKQIINRTLSGLRTAMKRAMPSRSSSRWSDYVETASHYSLDDHASKKRFLDSVFAEYPPKRVLDIGCNTGVYSRFAASVGAEVVSIDADTNAVNRLCLELGQADENILPLCIDFSQPTPATGWDNDEHPSFIQRASGHFDTLLLLAVLHHLLLNSQIPMEHVAHLCNKITTRNLLIEWVPPSDPKFIEVLRGREGIYRHLTESSFRLAFAPYFTTAQELLLSNGRLLLHLRKR